MGRNEPEDPLLAELLAWASAIRASDAAASRRAVRSLAEQAAADATWTGLAVDLAERRSRVVLVTGSSRWSGRLVGVGRDFVALERQGAGPVLVAGDALVAVEPAGPVARRPAGDRSPPLDLSLGAVLEALAGEASPITVWTGPLPFRGFVASVGRDLMTLVRDSAPPGEVHLRLGALDAIELR